MSSFFKRQPELFDTKKLGTSHGSGSNLAAAGLALSPAAASASADDTESVPGMILGDFPVKTNPIAWSRKQQQHCRVVGGIGTEPGKSVQ